MPDPRRPFRRLVESTLPTRLIAHLTVVTLVVAASLVGISQADGSGSSTAIDETAFSLVSQVRGAADATQPQAPSSLEVNPLIEEGATLDRGARAVVPELQPLPTPVAVDPDATPLAAPDSATGTTATASSGTATTRGPAPRAAGALVWPVPGGTISQYYHAGHLALDIAAPYGSTVVAAQAGVVTWSGWRNNGGGYVIQIDHGNGMQTVYNHLAGLWVSAGQYVAAGQAIAPVGMTGIATGPHVHFEVIVNGVIDNPLRYF
ncbi:MAG TPA: peptidoglycan DD-metalloendopeptidase family protein [Candidatus Limnocylindria bacterium]|nr:peptidoglycan DD-metalloendopeptidase family protein [Candidatus Limnocylindria bacterium]